MDIKKRICVIFLTWLCVLYVAQITDDSVKIVNYKYSKFYQSSLIAISPNNRWAVITDTNIYGLQRAKVLDISQSKTKEIPFSNNFFFFNDNTVIAQGTEQTIIKNLTKRSEKIISGNFQYLAFLHEGKLVFYERKRKELLILDSNLRELLSLKDLEMLNYNDELPFLYYAIANRIYRIDLRSMKRAEWKNLSKNVWIGGTTSEVVAVQNVSGNFSLSRYEEKSTVPESVRLDLPDNFYVDSLSISLFELKNNRYLVVPVKKKILKKNERAEIFYTNQNSNYKVPIPQMAIYDLEKRIWKRLPNKSDEFATQQFIDKKGTILFYDPSGDKVDSLINARYDQKIETEFGGFKGKIDNSYVRSENFYFDSQSRRMIYFKDHRWRIENTTTNITKEIPFKNPEHFIGEVYSGLSDRPSGKIYPTNLRSQYIITDDYDLFLVDLIKVTAKRLTFGREAGLMYSIAEAPRLKNRPDSYWVKETNSQIDLNKGVIIKALNRKDYSSKLCEFSYKSLKLKEVATMDNVVQDIYRGDNSIVYTMESYQKPLSVNVLQNGISKVIYQSNGVDEGKLMMLKKEIINYNVNGRPYNAVLLYPANFKLNNKYPIIFDIYERKSKDALNYLVPHLYDMQGFNIMHYVYDGYFVLLPDFDYELENVGRSISNSVDALLSVLKNNISVDVNKMAVTGSSFGGYETTFLMTQDKWFKTGFAGVSFVDLPRQATSYHKISYFNIPDYARLESQQNRMVKNLFENYQGYLDNSPIYHLKKLSKPVFLWAGKDDDNINIDQSRSFFIGMKRLGKKGILLEYPKEKHNLRIKENQLDLNVKGWQWMDFQLKDNKPADWIRPMLE
ncbi:hypothetical protein EIB75_13160 [Epilithonimonas vandammei]|uniref:Peptidase S9 prolyl oligopeptidase catalytic domain-containing protein n=1 Tax=Epilithonimonas vandammei TaxID=2487072 RepID=A0A3G8ZG04_9FLAO|nr:prolyl oligopeptidase family serine peptidase [Epilithonimonas vandammei]AZI56148.1 hypothetical protein EIB75_13160 [Epilithonimonas vandammei]